MKKFIIVVIVIAVLGIGVLGYFALRCNHESKTLIEDTATCLLDGKKTYRCDSCGETMSTVSLSKGHRLDTIVSDTATCTEDGEITAKCSVCGYLQVSPSARTGHDYEGIYCKTCGNLKDDCYGGNKTDFSNDTFEIEGPTWRYMIDLTQEVLGTATPTVTLTKNSNVCKLNLKVNIDKALSTEHNLQVTAFIYDKANNQLGYGAINSSIKYKGSVEDYQKTILGIDIKLTREILEGDEIYIYCLKNDTVGRT